MALEFGNGWRCRCGAENTRAFDTCSGCGGDRSLPPASPDPRVKVGEGPHPNLAAVTELAERVHHQLDMLGVARRVDAGELTLLGRMAEWLTADARASVGGDLTTARDYLALPGVVGVQDCGASNLIVYVERGCSTDDAHWLSAHIGEHKAVNTLVAIERDRRVDERRQA